MTDIELLKCASPICDNEKPYSEMKTCMHAERAYYVCTSKCMRDFYELDVHAPTVSIKSKTEKDLEDANNLINSVRKVLASTIPEHGVKEALIQLRQYKKEKSV